MQQLPIQTKPHFALELNVTSKDSIAKGIGKILETFKQPPTIVVNSAGITKDNFLLKMSEEDFDAVINVNLKGTFLIMQQFAQAMIAHQVGGSIVNLSSIVARTGNMGQANYSPSKAGVEAITSVASKEFAKFNIRVNAVLPGFINSPMTEIVPDKVKDIVKNICAMKRFGEPEEIGEVIAFLASDRSSYVNGASILVTGGGF
jgi:17beta-estradiol 17-dehydrogenase / 3alpha(17beta)-hydroxysteroid dehydrogenase (NAD+) / 3-oxoacyl-[acyl-carrier protein] reductase alpha subunit